jgi:hypothetical protein
MSQLSRIQLEDGTMIYLESAEEVRAPRAEEMSFDVTRGGEESVVTKGGMEQALQKFESLKGTIRAYTTYTLNAFKELAVANVEKVILEFGVKIGGEAGIPYITKGTAESNLKITVQCSFSETKK